MSLLRHFSIACTFAAAGCIATATAESPDSAFAGDPSITIKYLPGKYYEQQALLAVKAKKYGEAVTMYEKAGYWGNKIAQYDVGMLYLNGAEGVPADKIRGIAWLGIAAQAHAAYMDKALGEAYAAATAQERTAAGAIYKQLVADYGDKITLDRASKRFNAQYLRDKGQINGPPEYTTIVYGNFGGGGGDDPILSPMISQIDKTAQTADSHSVNAAKFFAAVKDQFSDFIHVQFGAVTVGEPESVSEREERIPDKVTPSK